MDITKIKAFVQNTLGCSCPEEVFHHIDCVSGIQREGFDIWYRINIGNRLLVYVSSIDSGDSLKELLPKLIDIGRKERDTAGFNRFRLVLATGGGVDARKTVEDIFADIQKDEKVHIHILPKSSIPSF